MRVITGSARGVRLQAPKGMDTRPTLDQVKGGIFSAIQFEVEGRRVLDLFAGSGQMGIEALSRGAKSAVWRQIKADVTSIPVGLAAQSESTSLGAAMLAAVACGGKASLEQAAQAADRAVVWTKPDGAGRYEQAYQKYCELFRTLNPLF